MINKSRQSGYSNIQICKDAMMNDPIIKKIKDHIMRIHMFNISKVLVIGENFTVVQYDDDIEFLIDEFEREIMQRMNIIKTYFEIDETPIVRNDKD